jgi:hypothetical protein
MSKLDHVEDIGALQARIAELEADKRRLDWLESKAAYLEGKGIDVLGFFDLDSRRTWSVGITKHSTVRELIDAAMEGK